MNEKQGQIIVFDYPDEGNGEFWQRFAEDRSGIFSVDVQGSQQGNLGKAPQVVVLDVDSDATHAYQKCKDFKKSKATSDVDIILVSTNESIDEKIRGYNAGASDYLIKPLDPREVEKKLELAINNNIARRDALAKQSSAEAAAMAAIVDANEQTVVASFLRLSQKASSFEALAKNVIESVQLYGLSCTIQIRNKDTVFNKSSREPIPPLEKDLLFRLKDFERIIPISRRLILNFNDLSLLIKNMPEDEEKCGRLRDHLALIMEGAENQYDTLCATQQLRELLDESQQALGEIQEVQAQQKEQFVSIVDNLQEELQASFLSWGLTEQQENILMALVEKASTQTINNFEAGIALDEKMEMIVESIHDFVSMLERRTQHFDQQNELLEFF